MKHQLTEELFWHVISLSILIVKSVRVIVKMRCGLEHVCFELVIHNPSLLLLGYLEILGVGISAIKGKILKVVGGLLINWI